VAELIPRSSAFGAGCCAGATSGVKGDETYWLRWVIVDLWRGTKANTAYSHEFTMRCNGCMLILFDGQ
jgi:hypothetical protein